MRIRRSTGFIVLSLLTAFFLAACGGGGGGGSTAPAPVPIVTTSGASSINIDNAVFSGTVNPNGLATTVWFEYGTSPTLATYDCTSVQTLGPGFVVDNVTFTRTGLSAGTDYWYRIAANNSAGTSKDPNPVHFTTASFNSPPTVALFAPDNVSIIGMTLHGNVGPNGSNTNAYFVYGPDPTLTNLVTTSKTTTRVLSGIVSVPMDEPISSLSPATEYYFKLVAQNAFGLLETGISHKSTNSSSPNVHTNAAVPATDNAVFSGTVNPNGLPTTAWFEYGTSPTLATYDCTSVQAVGSGLVDNSVAFTKTGLIEFTDYYYRVVANNTAGTSRDTPPVYFKTLQNPPPNAVAGIGETVWVAGPYGNKGYLGSTVVTLDGSASNDPYGTIASYEWTQIDGIHTVAISNPADNTTTFTTFVDNTFTYGMSDNLVFQLKVTDNRGLSGTDNTRKNVKWGFLDDFSTDSTGTYNVFQTLGNPATFSYDAGGKRATVQGGDNAGIIFSKEFKILPDVKLYTSKGVFSFDFNPVTDFGSGGYIKIRLQDAFDTYYELSTADNLVKKVRAGATVDSAPFPFQYSQGSTNPITITFSQDNTTFEAFGGSVSLTTDTQSNPVVYFEIETNQQDANYDNILLEAAP